MQVLPSLLAVKQTKFSKLSLRTAPAAHAQLVPTRTITVIKIILAARAAWNLKVLLRVSRRLLLAMAVTISSMLEMVTQLLLIALYAMYVNVKFKFKLL